MTDEPGAEARAHWYWYSAISTEATVHGRLVALAAAIKQERDAAYRRGIEECKALHIAARNLADYYEKSLNVGPGLHPTRETLLWASLRRALAPPPEGS